MPQTNGHTNGHTNGMNGTKLDADWWRQATVYQIYPRSFADGNGDGIGDLVGITQKVPYLASLGIDAVWLSPFYPSALKDGGYDVADYRDVDPKIGTLADFDEMMKAFKAVGIQVMVDIVPNHCSDDHEWFQAALKAGRGSKERERFIFRDGKGPDGSEPPCDWHCLFGGSAWDRVDDGQYYLHLFDSSQPDFNWENPEVRADFLKTLRFWADKGVAGFRVDVAMGCAKDMSEPYPSQAELDLMSMAINTGEIEANTHPFWDRDEVHEIFKGWREVFNEYDPPLTAVAEAWVAPNRNHLYASPEGLGQSFSFDMLQCDYDAEKFKECIDASLKNVQQSGSSTTWVFSNHDVIRHATRFGIKECTNWGGPNAYQAQSRDYLLEAIKTRSDPGDPALGLKRAKAATLMMLALPGSAYIYQGEELGLPEVTDIPPEKRQDPLFIRKNGGEIGRDGCRVPIPWSSCPGPNHSFGFSPSNTKATIPPHLPAPEWWGGYSVENEEKDSSSTLQFYRKALKLKRELQGPEKLEWAGTGQTAPENGVVHFERPGTWQVIMNVSNGGEGGGGVEIPKGEILIASGELVDGRLPINTTVWVKSEA